MKKPIHPKRAKRIKRVMVFGTFDRLHLGHLNFFDQSAKFGKLFVVLARDVNVVKIKNRRPQFPERSRLATVAQSSKVFQAMLGDKKDFLKPIVKIRPDVICLGFDQKTFSITELKTNLKKRNLAPRIIRLKSFQPSVFKSSLINKKIR
ncbi:adenylyltransferase/cytidyltransferase family protein [Patescibacteria group bacterium]|nr:adenylyltransferase/cytidyltransferase family protein [Patescibacteria group bacterium]